MGKGLGIASLVMSILAFIPPCTSLGWILATAGIITGVMGKKDPESRGLAKAGMIIGIVWWCLAVLGAILYALYFIIVIASLGAS